MEYRELSLKLQTKVGQLSAIFQCMNMKLRQYQTVFPSNFKNIFMKYFRLLQNLMRNGMIIQQFTRFHETNKISGNCSGITLGFCEISKYFVDFQFCFKYLRKMTVKFRLLWNRFEISKFHTFRWRKLKKVNITVTQVYNTGHWSIFFVRNSDN